MSALVKIAVVVLVIVGVIYLLDAYWPQSEPKPEGSLYDTFEKDDKKHHADAEFDESAVQTETAGVETAIEQPRRLAEEVQPPAKPQFTELSLEEQVEAERLFEFAVSQFKMGRLPITGFKPMVDACRKIIAEYPDSEWAFKAKRLISDMPTRFRKRYKITKEELDLGGLK